MAICGRKAGYTSDIFFSKYVDMGIKSLIRRSKRFVKIFENIRSKDIKVEKTKQINKSAVFPSFSAPT